MMRSTKIPVLVSLGLLLALSGLPTPAVAGSEAKVAVCHIPPGDPGNFHTILVSESALPAHLAHGDFVGACGLYCESLCNDYDACTADSCDASEQCVHSPANCNDSNACTADSCDPASGCVNTPLTGDACTVTDADPCTTGDGTCDASGQCVPVRVPGCCDTDADCEPYITDPCLEPQCFENTCTGVPKNCDTGDPCNQGYCDPTTGQCAVAPKVCPAQPCYTAMCNAEGNCVSTRIEGCCLADADCDDGNACTINTCVDGTCSSSYIGGTDPCLVYSGDGGLCVGTPLDCSTGDPCVVGTCVDGACVDTSVGPYCYCSVTSSCSDCCQTAGNDAAQECESTCSTSLECSKCASTSAVVCNGCLTSCGSVPSTFYCQ